MPYVPLIFFTQGPTWQPAQINGLTGSHRARCCALAHSWRGAKWMPRAAVPRQFALRRPCIMWTLGLSKEHWKDVTHDKPNTSKHVRQHDSFMIFGLWDLCRRRWQLIRKTLELWWVWCDVGSKLLRSIICASTVTCSVCMTVATRRIQVLLWCRWRRSSTYFKPVILVTGIIGDWYHTFPTGDLVWLQGGGIAPLGGSTLPLVGCRKRASTQQDRSFQKETMEKGTDMERYMI